MKRWMLSIGMLALSSMFCSVNVSQPPTPTVDVAAIVNATLTAFVAGQPTATPTQAMVVATATPTTTAQPEVTVTATATQPARDFIPPMGTITGTLMYPAGGVGLPSLRIVAFPVDGSTPSYTDTALGQGTYSFDLPAGTYHIVAYVLPGGAFTGGLPGGYTRMVPCGLKYGCDDHTLIDVTVTAGATTSGIDPNDYYAPAGAFPPMPAP